MKREPLGDGYVVLTDKVNTFSADSLLLADLAPVKETAVDLCSGCGVVALLLHKKGCSAVTAVEIDETAASLIGQSVKESGVHITVQQADVRTVTGRYHLVTCNPPYFKEGRSPDPRKNQIRSECLLSPEELFATVRRLLTEDGVFCFCHREERREELTGLLRQQGLYLHRIRWVRPSPCKPPYLFVAEAGRRETVLVTEDLSIRDEEGRETQAYRRICGLT